MFARVHFTGDVLQRLRSATQIAGCVLRVSSRRMRKGSVRPGWNLFTESCTEILKRQVATAFAFTDVKQARAYLDHVEIRSHVLKQVTLTPAEPSGFHGIWFTPKHSTPDLTLFYLHGGGYSFYPQSYANFIALITQAANSRTFALDYRLAPEHRFPSQLDDALGGYRWLLSSGVDPGEIVIAGDSAGGHLTLGLLLAVRDAKLPLPALAIALSPPIGFEIELMDTDGLDWITKQQVLLWADWFCDPARHSDPRVSLLRADWRGLPPIYLQAGSAELLFKGIQSFANHAKAQGADVCLEAWDGMPHVFQVFGPDAPQSTDALQRIREVIEKRIRGNTEETISCCKENTPCIPRS